MIEGTFEENEMDLHRFLKQHGKSELLLHPILQIFLDLKWNQVKMYYWVTLLFDIMFVGVLIFSAYHFLNLVFCVACLEAETPTFQNWSMNINYHDMEGKIKCFSPNTTLFSISKEDQEICLKDMEFK